MTREEIIKVLDNSAFKPVESKFLDVTYEYGSKDINREIVSVSIDGVLDCVTFLLIDWEELTVKVSLTFLAKELFSLEIEDKSNEISSTIEVRFNNVYKVRFNK